MARHKVYHIQQLHYNSHKRCTRYYWETINSIEIANTLNKSFVDVAENISKNIPRTPKLPLDYLNGRNTNSMFLFPVPHIEGEDVISNLDLSKSCRPHSVPIYILNVLGPYISKKP